MVIGLGRNSFSKAPKNAAQETELTELFFSLVNDSITVQVFGDTPDITDVVSAAPGSFPGIALRGQRFEHNSHHGVPLAQVICTCKKRPCKCAAWIRCIFYRDMDFADPFSHIRQTRTRSLLANLRNCRHGVQCRAAGRLDSVQRVGRVYRRNTVVFRLDQQRQILLSIVGFIVPVIG